MADSKRNVSINFEEVALKLHKLLDLFDKLKDDKVDLIFVCTGKTQNDANASSSEMFQLWLTGFQFPETLFVFSSSGTWYMLTSAKKSTYLEPIKEKYQNVKILTRVPGQPDDILLEQIFSDFKNPLVGVLDETKPLGDFADGCYKVLEDKERRNIGKYISDMLLVRTSVELETQRQASQLACGVMKTYLINQIENILDSESKTPHSTIVASSYEFHSDEKFLEKMERRYNMNRNDMEVIYSNVQSGGKFTFGIGVKPTADNLSHEPGSIIISVCTKYSELCACLTRTLLLDSTSGHKDAYRFATKVFDYTLSKLKAGTTFASVYKSVYEFVSKENKGYETNLVRSLGHTIGLEFKDSNYTIIETNERCVVENDMVFHLSVGFNELELDEGKPFAIWIADTVHVTADGANILTSFVSKSLENISYELEDEVSEGEEEERKPVVSSQILRDADSVILKERLRNRDRAGIVPGSEEHIELLSKQKDLRNKKIEEISKRFKDSGGLGDGNKEKQVIKMDKIHVFSSPELFASDIVPHKIYVDWRNEAVMLPINGYHLPFSVMIIKNVTCNSEEDSNTFTLRINFQVPGSHTYSTRGDVNPLPDLVDENSLFIKEVLYKSKDTKHIQNVFRSIKDLIKQIKQRENDDSNVVLAEQDKLQLNKTGRRIVLKDLMIRPNIHGSRRIIGFLEAHHNGLRYLVNTRDRVDNVDITYSNIKHAIFQPCERELIVLLHFHLKSPIMVGKRKTFDIQFYCEVGTQIDDLDNRRGRSYNDPDETMEEMRERELRRKLNTDFKLFVSQIHELSKINVNLPYRDLMFTGVPLKSNVELLPTENCLVHLVEWPPFILSLNDIEIISLERIQHGLRNFDMVFINKDYSKPIKRVDLIPVEYLDNIKRWLNELEIVWYEGKNNLQWTNILKTILEDVESFIENGCFDGFLGEDETEEEDEDLGDDDEDYDADDSDEEGEDDDDEEFDEDDESLADEDEDEEEYEEEDDEEGLSWDELEERAKEDDDNISYYDDERKPQKKQRR